MATADLRISVPFANKTYTTIFFGSADDQIDPRKPTTKSAEIRGSAESSHACLLYLSYDDSQSNATMKETQKKAIEMNLPYQRRNHGSTASSV